MTRLIVATHVVGLELEALETLATDAGAQLLVTDRVAELRDLAAGTQVYACACASEVSAELRAQDEAGHITLGHTYHLRRSLALEHARKQQ